MAIGVLGTGMVGRALSGALADTGEAVMIGSRDPAQLWTRPASDWLAAFAEWKQDHPTVEVGTFAEAAGQADIVFNATAGNVALHVLGLAGRDNLDGKILVDVSNPLDFSGGMPPSLFVCNTDSLAEQIQRALPGVRVVKALNTVTAALMAEPLSLAEGDHDIFVSGNDADAKATVIALLQDRLGWRGVIDLGDITTARGTEMLMPMWLRLMEALGTPNFNWRIVR